MLPKIVRVLRVIIGIQVYRLVGLSLLQQGTLLPVFVIPVVAGDVLTGLTASIVGLAVSMKRGPKVWATALVWNALGLVDLFYALTLASLTNAPSFVLTSDLPVLIGAILGIILHIISIGLLLRRTTVDYFVKN